jgi:hypothetical protein
MVGLYPPEPDHYDNHWTFVTGGCGCCTDTYHDIADIKAKLDRYEGWLKEQLALVARFRREVE